MLSLTAILALVGIPAAWAKRSEVVPATNKPKPDPHTMDEFIAWLETRPPEEKYPWHSLDSCLLIQYRKHINWPVGKGGYPNLIRSKFGYDPLLFEGAIARAEPHTFGAALDRARAYKVSQL